MDRDMVYICGSSNKSIPMCRKGVVSTTTPLHSWKYSNKHSKNNLSDMFPSSDTKKITALFSTKDLANRARLLFQTDIKTKKPGKIRCGDWELDAYIVGAKKSSDIALLYELTIAPLDGVWRRKVSGRLITPENISSDYLDYPYDYEYDYQGYKSTTLVDTSNYYNSPVSIIFYGPCVNPFVICNGNKYQVDVDVPTGYRVEIDGVRKTVELIGEYGYAQNIFDKAHRGEGEYIFKTLPSGSFEVTYSSGVSTEFGWYEEDGELPWT